MFFLMFYDCLKEILTSFLCSLNREKGVQLDIILNMEIRENFAIIVV